MNPIVRENLVRELEHMVQHRPPAGTLFMIVRETPDMLVATLREGVISLAYPHAGVFDIFRSNRFAAFCRKRGFVVQKEQWHNVRVSYALIGTVAAHAAQTIDECFSSVFRLSGPFGLELKGMGWHSPTGRSQEDGGG